ncbi:MAG: GNAT family N-acetyltransferase [Paracoccaceae bacterium]
MITLEQIYATIDATWPAARFEARGPWTLRDGQGGGKRVSAASTVQDDVTDQDVADAVAGQAAMGQAPLFMIREGQAALDAKLATLGYETIDASVAYAASVADLTAVPLPRVTVLPHWEPLVLTREIWGKGGIGPARVAVMMRATGPRVALLGRNREQPAGAAFVAVSDGIAMLHALEILPEHRREGMGQWFMRGAAAWAADQGAHTLAVICTRANAGANALYASLGMQAVGGYHYRHLPEERGSRD